MFSKKAKMRSAGAEIMVVCERIKRCTSVGSGSGGYLFLRQTPEQYFTASQSFRHFLRQAKGRPQAAQTLVGRFTLPTGLPMVRFSPS